MLDKISKMLNVIEEKFPGVTRASFISNTIKDKGNVEVSLDDASAIAEVLSANGFRFGRHAPSETFRTLYFFVGPTEGMGLAVDANGESGEGVFTIRTFDNNVKAAH